jgi:hypothetical protein
MTRFHSRPIEAILLGVTGSCGTPLALASSMPPATTQLQVQVDTPQGPEVKAINGKYRTIKLACTADDGSSESALASSTNGSDPTVHVHAARSCLHDGCIGAPDFGMAAVAYAFRVKGPKGTVKVDYGAVANTSYTSEDYVFAQYWITSLAGTTGFCAGGADSCGDTGLGLSFNEQGSVDVEANQIYYVTLHVEANAAGGATPPNSVVDAKLSATLQLDPMFQGGSYVLQFSRGFAAP